jgi:hypothetical protein
MSLDDIDDEGTGIHIGQPTEEDWQQALEQGRALKAAGTPNLTNMMRAAMIAEGEDPRPKPKRPKAVNGQARCA